MCQFCTELQDMFRNLTLVQKFHALPTNPKTSITPWRLQMSAREDQPYNFMAHLAHNFRCGPCLPRPACLGESKQLVRWLPMPPLLACSGPRSQCRELRASLLGNPMSGSHAICCQEQVQADFFHEVLRCWGKEAIAQLHGDITQHDAAEFVAG